MKKKTSLKDIAKEVGVSIATVSYVLSKGEESRIGKEVYDKIKLAAVKLEYSPNQIAKSLKTGRTFTIGLIVADISNPFFADIARIVEDEAAKFGFTVLFASSDEKSEKSWNLIQTLMSRQVDGFIIAPAEGTEKQIEYLKSSNVPFVLIDRYFPDISTNYVIIDNFQISYKSTERLIHNGNDKIGIIAYSTKLYHMKQRIEGYKKALTDNSLKVNEKHIKEVDFFNIEDGIEQTIDELLAGDEKVTAIFFATNTLAVAGIKYINKLNYKIPDDIAIICFDKGEAFDFYYCPITYIDQPIGNLGKKAVEILKKSIEKPDDNFEQIFLEAELIINKSCVRS